MKPLPINPRGFTRDVLLLAMVTLAGSAIRTVAIARWPLWGDEGLSVTLAQWPARELLLLPIDPTPGLYYFLHQLIVPDNAGVALVRAISLVAGTLCIPAIYAVGRLAIDRQAGLVAAILLALSPPLVDYAQEARAYSTLVLLVLLSAASHLWWGREIGRGSAGTAPLLLMGAFMVLAFYTHLISIFWIGPALFAAVMHTVRLDCRRAIRHLLLIMLLMFWIAAPEFLRMLYRLKLYGGFDWLEQVSPIGFLITLGEVLLPSGLWNNRSAMAPEWFPVVAVLGLTGVLAWRLRSHRYSIADWSDNHPLALPVTAILLAAPLLIWLFGFALTPIFMPRTMLIGIPGLLLLAALMHQLGDRWLAWLLGAGSAIALILTGTVREKEDWRSVAAALQKSWLPGDAILFCAAWKWPAFRHAQTSLLGGPILIPTGRGELFQIEPLAGGASDWALRYKRLTDGIPETKELGPAAIGVPFSPRRYWWVQSECRDREIRSFEAWVGPVRWSRVSTWAEGDPSLRISLFLSDELQPQARRVRAAGSD